MLEPSLSLSYQRDILEDRSALGAKAHQISHIRVRLCPSGTLVHPPSLPLTTLVAVTDIRMSALGEYEVPCYWAIIFSVVTW